MTKLTPEQEYVMRQKGNEIPFSGKHLNENRPGVFTCADCGTELFKSEAKYESRIPGLMGWPSFSDVAASGRVKLIPDDRYGMQRTEVVCAKCDGHLGHVFDGDPDSPTGQHYCINSLSLDFKPGKH